MTYHFRRESHADISQIACFFAFQYADGFLNFKRVSDIITERRVHIGYYGCHISAAALAYFDHFFSKASRVVDGFHKRPAAHLYIKDNGMRTGSKFFAHDTRCNERNTVNRRGQITQRIHYLIGGSKIAGLSDNGNSDFFDLFHEILRRERGLVPRDRFEFINRSAGVTESPAAHFCDLAPYACRNRGNDKSSLVAYSAGGMLIDRQIPETRQINGVARVRHVQSK